MWISVYCPLEYLFVHAYLVSIKLGEQLHCSGHIMNDACFHISLIWACWSKRWNARPVFLPLIVPKIIVCSLRGPPHTSNSPMIFLWQKFLDIMPFIACTTITYVASVALGWPVQNCHVKILVYHSIICMFSTYQSPWMVHESFGSKKGCQVCANTITPAGLFTQQGSCFHHPQLTTFEHEPADTGAIKTRGTINATSLV